MSWRYRRSSHKSRRRTFRTSTYKPPYFFFEKDIDFTLEHLDYKQFLLQEFFTADDESRKKLDSYYLTVYGSRSLAYLQRKYSEWAAGDYHLTDLMRDRILFIMPKFLGDEAKQKLGLFEFMSSIKKIIKKYLRDQTTRFSIIKILNHPNEVSEIFQKEFDKINELSIGDLKYNVLTEQEREEALEISKYILEEKLIYYFLHVQSDFETFLPFLKRCTFGVFDIKYSITQFNLQVALDPSVKVEIEDPDFAPVDVGLDGRFKQYAAKYLAYELGAVEHDMNVAVCHSFLSTNDMDLFFFQYEELIRKKNETALNSTFQGEGGILSLSVQIQPIRKLASLIFSSSIIILAILGVYWFIINGLIANSKWVWIGLILGCWLIPSSIVVVLEQINTIRQLIIQIRSKSIFVNK